MSERKIQEMGLNKKKFPFDIDSSDEEGPQKHNIVRSKRSPTNPNPFSKNKSPLVDKIIEESESDDDADLHLSEIYGVPRKRLHMEFDQYLPYNHDHTIFQVKSAQSKSKSFFRFHENGVAPEGLRWNKEEPNFDEDSSSEYVSEGHDAVVPQCFSEFEIEEIIDFNVFDNNLCEEEVEEDLYRFQDVKPYLFETENAHFFDFQKQREMPFLFSNRMDHLIEERAFD